MVAWPGSLPAKPLIDSLGVQTDDNVLRFKPDVGVEIRRARYTAVSEHFSFTLYLKKTELATLKTFYKTTLGNGVTSFDFTDPLTGATGTFSFAGPYGVQSMSSPDLFAVTLTLEKPAE